MSSNKAIVKILLRYKQREVLSTEELEELRLWLMESPGNEELFAELSSPEWEKEMGKWKGKEMGATWDKIVERLESVSPEVIKKKRERGRYLVAASILFILLSAGLYFQVKRTHLKETPEFAQKPRIHDILPSSGSASLTLSNGQKMVLDSMAAGTQNLNEGIPIVKTDSDALAYKTTGEAVGEEKYNTLTTSKGNLFRLILSDGTRVWLNASSSLRFPVVFSGAERKVELTGEGYFEVAKNKSKPFIVETRFSTRVQVFGTHFNVKAYADETEVNVTLLEGAITASNAKKSMVVKPGEECILNDEGPVEIQPANLEQVMAWKSRLFWFKKASFQSIMRELSRWYEMDVVYQGSVNASYTGILPGNLPLSNVLGILEKGGNVHFDIKEGQKVFVRP